MQVYGLVGNPVEHSLSPPMHEAAYDRLALDARYVTFEPVPERLGDALAGADALGIAGLNVTIPFKETALEHVAAAPLAARIGAVNTVVLEAAPGYDAALTDVEAAVDAATGAATAGADAVGVGYNTDAIGAIRALEHHDVALDGRAVVVGAGGAGRAVSFGLADAGMRVRVVNRTVERAERLAAAVEGATAHPLDDETVTDLLAEASVLVNCTSVGMNEDASPVPAAALHEELSVLDAVYTPIRTRLLSDAAAVGARTVDGAWMLLYQGVAAFERWTGRSAPVAAMNDALRTRL